MQNVIDKIEWMFAGLGGFLGWFFGGFDGGVDEFYSMADDPAGGCREN